MSLPAIEIAVKTDPGRDPEKQVNEDSAAHAETPLGILAVVCDGMGGHAGGKEASELAVATILDCMQNAPAGASPRDALKAAIEEANARVWAMPTAEAGFRPGSTVVAVLAHAFGAEVAHVGDSRVYLVHAGAIAQVTRDHSMVQEMVARNLIRAEDAAQHPDANKILRALGIAKDVEVELRPEPVTFTAGDVFVLCSDGLSDLVSAAEILGIAGTHPPMQAAGQLVDLANARGGHDNITALLLRTKTAANVSDAPTIVKTVAITAHEPPMAPPEGPKGTMLVAPAAPPTVASSPNMTAIAGPAPVTIPQAPPPTIREESRAPVNVIIGVVLAVIALGGLGAFWWTSSRPQRHEVPVMLPEAGPKTTTTTATLDGDAGEPAAITAAPLLATPPKPTGSVPLTGDACSRARQARDRGLPATLIARLEDKCRADGGVP